MSHRREDFSNSKPIGDSIRLSIVSPFYKDDPCGWIAVLSNDKHAQATQIVLVDDGTCDGALTAKIRGAIENWPGPATLLSFSQNEGRAIARNRGLDIAIGEYIIFSDADMVPKNADYLEKYFSIIDKSAAAIVFGGFITKANKLNHETLLHHQLSQSGDCRTLADRKTLGAYAVASNNLMVRKSVMNICPFDRNFKGWGWEDTEWALRATAMGFGLLHIDNPAIHIGLDTSTTMLNKYREAGANLKIMLEKHPIANRFASARAANMVSNLPFHSLFRPLAKIIVLNKLRLFPIKLRQLAIKYWRASWAAEALQK